jgi:hypothetical protein
VEKRATNSFIPARQIHNELRRTKSESENSLEQAKYADKNWYEGGMWRAPELLPASCWHKNNKRSTAGVWWYGNTFHIHVATVEKGAVQPMRMRPAISLSDLFFNLVMSRLSPAGVAISASSR